MKGCDWDPNNKQLCESKPKMLFVDAPLFWLVPKLSKAGGVVEDRHLTRR